MPRPRKRPGTGPRPGCGVQLLPIPKHGEICVRFLDDLHGCVTHWLGDHSFPCGLPGRCDPRVHIQALNYKGYASVELWTPAKKRWYPWVLEVPEGIMTQHGSGEVRGEIWYFWRIAEGTNIGEARGKCVDRVAETFLPEKFDMTPTLCSVFRCLPEDIHLDQPNPKPPRVYRDPSHGDEPPPLKKQQEADKSYRGPSLKEVDEQRRKEAGKNGTH